MKTLSVILTSVFLLFLHLTTNAQDTKPLPDQNPNYKKSLERYMKKADSLNIQQGSTVQQTYKAEDWMQMKIEQKALRKERRYSIRMARAYSRNRYNPYSYYPNYNYCYPNYGNYYPYYGYSYPYYGGSNWVNPAIGLGLLGLGIYSVFH